MAISLYWWAAPPITNERQSFWNSNLANIHNKTEAQIAKLNEIMNDVSKLEYAGHFV